MVMTKEFPRALAALRRLRGELDAAEQHVTILGEARDGLGAEVAMLRSQLRAADDRVAMRVTEARAEGVASEAAVILEMAEAAWRFTPAQLAAAALPAFIAVLRARAEGKR